MDITPQEQEIILDYYNRIYTQAKTIDPDDSYTWDGLVIGFLMGAGVSFERAKELLPSIVF